METIHDLAHQKPAELHANSSSLFSHVSHHDMEYVNHDSAEWTEDRDKVSMVITHFIAWCMPNAGYYVFRFGLTPESYISDAAGLKAPVYIQQQMLVARGTPGVPTRYEWVQEAYEQLLLCKHEGRPHTGKNWDRTFTNPR